ncbi:hypothetical protein GW17_00034494 [Ensete ventricosum]|nr:hypothetical protein GW17_00034494 [Ensete ventricosum]
MVASGRSKGRRRAWLRQRRLRQREEKAAGSGEEEEVGEQRRFGNSPGVRQEFAEGIGSLLGWRKGVHWKKTETRRKIVGGLTTTGAIELQPDDGPRSSLGIRPGSDDAAGPRREFTRRFAKGIGKLAWNTPGERRKKTRRLAARMPEAVGLAGVRRTGPYRRTEIWPIRYDMRYNSVCLGVSSGSVTVDFDRYRVCSSYRPIQGSPRTGKPSDRYVSPVSGGIGRYGKP